MPLTEDSLKKSETVACRQRDVKMLEVQIWVRLQ
jgi:hypothetical protein